MVPTSKLKRKFEPLSKQVTKTQLLGNASQPPDHITIGVCPAIFPPIVTNSPNHAMVTNQELNQRREPGCWGVTQDKKYFHVGNSCIKRTLRRHEWITLHDENLLIVPPATIQQRWRTDAAALRFLAERTNIPLPPFQFVMEDDGAFYHATEFVEGVSMKHLNETDKQVVKKELMQHMETLRSLTSETPGVPGEELLCPPARVSGPSWKMHSCWKPKQIHAGEDKYVFCHNGQCVHFIYFLIMC